MHSLKRHRQLRKVRSYLPLKKFSVRNRAMILWRVVEPGWGTCYTFKQPRPDEVSSLRIRPIISRRRRAFTGWDCDRGRFMVEGRKRRAKHFMDFSSFWNRQGWRLTAFGYGR